MYWCFLYYCLYTLIAWAHEHSDHARVLTGKTTTAAMSRFASTMLMISAPTLSESGVDNMSPGYLIREVFEGTSHQQNEDENNNAMTTPVPAILRRTCRRAVNITPPFMHLSPSDDLGSVERSRVSIVEPCRRVYNSDDAPSVFPFVHVHARAEVCRLRTCVRILVFAMPYTLTLSRWIFFRYCRVPCDTAKRLYLRISLFLETDIVWYHSMHLNPRIYSEEYRENTYTWSVLRIQYSSCFIRRCPSSVVVRHRRPSSIVVRHPSSSVIVVRHPSLSVIRRAFILSKSSSIILKCHRQMPLHVDTSVGKEWVSVVSRLAPEMDQTLL